MGNFNVVGKLLEELCECTFAESIFAVELFSGCDDEFDGRRWQWHQRILNLNHRA